MDGEAVALDPEAGLYHGYDDIATHIWHLLEDAKTFDALVDALTGRYAAGREVIARDLDVFLQDLHARGLVVLVPPV